MTQLVNPHVTQQGLVVKYCKRDKKQYSSSSSYLPPPPPPPPPNIDYGQVYCCIWLGKRFCQQFTDRSPALPWKQSRKQRQKQPTFVSLCNPPFCNSHSDPSRKLNCGDRPTDRGRAINSASMQAWFHALCHPFPPSDAADCSHASEIACHLHARAALCSCLVSSTSSSRWKNSLEKFH